ncbi:MAG: glycoside-pentoside-hexuronide (GPH):cation symporter [Treponemataceae bacterium]|nr:glycoside-pentoside-hexuronide (GPH):cation symporter [Treponemataceae bacterium]
MKEGKTSLAERGSYGLYFLGQNIFYMLVAMFLTPYYTDIGIAAGVVAIIALVVKVWDAVNDPLFGAIMDKIKFKKGIFLPWLKISLVGIPLATILMFAVPSGVSMTVKVVWSVIAYMLWDTAYTLCDVPIFGLVTTMTDVQNERTTLNAIGRVCAMIAILIVASSIYSFRAALGGWTSTVLLLSIIGAITMVPICFLAKERVTPKEDEKDQDFSVVDICKYVVTNKYLLIYYLSFLASGTLALGNVWGIYVARYCYGNEGIQTILMMLGMAPTIILGAFVPVICKKMDKMTLMRIALLLSLVMNVARFFVGYDSMTKIIVMAILTGIPGGFTATLMYMFTPDCVEYGHFKSGKSMPAITFATQTFFVKLASALNTSFGAAALAWIGFVSGENAVQAEGFASKLWFAFCLFTIIASVVQLVILILYKLNDKDVQLMANANSGAISREEALAQMTPAMRKELEK